MHERCTAVSKRANRCALRLRIGLFSAEASAPFLISVGYGRGWALILVRDDGVRLTASLGLMVIHF